MSELYLILHKVRGEPAFDIAEKIMIGDEEGWVIPTSGHRAYPYRDWPLDLIEGPAFYPQNLAWAFNKHPDAPDDWPTWPDHYDPKRDDGSHLVNQAREILMRKGLISAAKPAATLYRRA